MSILGSPDTPRLRSDGSPLPGHLIIKKPERSRVEGAPDNRRFAVAELEFLELVREWRGSDADAWEVYVTRLSALLEREPEFALARYELGRVLHEEKKNLDRAREELTLYLEASPFDPELDRKAEEMLESL